MADSRTRASSIYDFSFEDIGVTLNARDKFSVCGFFACSVTNFAIIKAVSLPGGGFPFRWMNLMFCVSVFMSAFTYFKSTDPFNSFTPRLMLCQAACSFVTLLGPYIFGPLGLALTDVKTAAAIFYTQLPITTLFTSMFDQKIPGFINMVIIFAATSTIVTFLTYSIKGESVSIVGITFLLIQMTCISTKTLINSRLMSAKALTISLWDKTFWFWFSKIFLSFCMIPIECYVVYGEFHATDMIPGYSLTLPACGVGLFLGIFNTFLNETAMLDANLFVSVFFTGTVLSSLFAASLHNFVGFDIVGYGMTIVIFLNALAYQFAYEAEEMSVRVQKLLDYMKKGDVTVVMNAMKQMRGPRESREMSLVIEKSRGSKLSTLWENENQPLLDMEL